MVVAGIDHRTDANGDYSEVWTVWDDNYSHPVNQKWFHQRWASPIQLVVCEGDEMEIGVKLDSCGWYTRKSDGVTGELERWATAETIRVVAARSGKTLLSETLYGFVEDCPKTYEVGQTEDPPWSLGEGDWVSNAQVNSYATAVSKQPLK